MICPHCGKYFSKEKENWSKVFGKSLNKLVANYKAKGMNPDTMLLNIQGQYSLSQEQLRRLEIGIHARYGEISSEMREYNETINNLRR